MGKVVIHRSETDLAVEHWLAGKNLTLDDVMSYTIERSASSTGTITLKLYYDEKPAAAERE